MEMKEVGMEEKAAKPRRDRGRKKRNDKGVGPSARQAGRHRQRHSPSHDLAPVVGLAGEVSGQAELFVSPSEPLHGRLLQATRQLYAIAKQHARGFAGSPLAELVTEGFDTEQVWEELQLQNKPLHRQLRAHIKHMLQNAPASKENDSTEPYSDYPAEENVEENGYSSSDDAEEPTNPQEQTETRETPPDPATATGDHFFNLEDMERFADEADEPSNHDAEESDEDKDDLSNDDEFPDFLHENEKGIKKPLKPQSNSSEITYEHFFDPPSKEVGKEHSQDSLDEGDQFGSETQHVSAYDREQTRLRAQIESLEERNLGEKPWLLGGEASATQRPLNSLLETHLDFDSASKVKPIVTEQTTRTLEDMIKARIREASWDDVERREEKDVARHKAQLPELDYEKSKRSLSEIYEEEYTKQTTVLPKSVAPEALTKEQRELQQMFRSLCFKLDSLSNFHFTPKPPLEEVEIRGDVAAITMEEIIPIGTSDASLLAPEEIYQASKELKGEAEITQQERRSNRRKKKRVAKKRARPQTVAAKQKTKDTRPSNVAAITTSSQLFRSLTAEATRHIRDKQTPAAAPTAERRKNAAAWRL